MNRTLCFVLGTRPEIIKVAPLIHACVETGTPYILIHTGQHYDKTLDAVFFEELSIPAPDFNLHSGEVALQYPEKLGLMTAGIERILTEKSVGVVVVQGDTTSALAGALAAKRVGTKVAHLEAGLRSRDYTMTEEWNRIMIDGVSDYLLAPTEACREQLLNESMDSARIHVVGNSIVDAVVRSRATGAASAPGLLARHGIKAGKYVLFTMHRAENTDVRERLAGILEGVSRVSQLLELPVVFPLHPRTKHACEGYGITLPPEILVIPPQGYIEFLQLEANARLIITDSGGLQEEASILHIPCVTVRDNTERPETVEAGVNILGYSDPQSILDAAKTMLERTIVWQDLYGDGTTAQKTLQILTSKP